jgi:hypothetical protein
MSITVETQHPIEEKESQIIFLTNIGKVSDFGYSTLTIPLVYRY